MSLDVGKQVHVVVCAYLDIEQLTTSIPNIVSHASRVTEASKLDSGLSAYLLHCK